MTRITTLLIFAFVLFFSSAVVARGGKHGGQGSHQDRHYNDRHYSRQRHHERYRSHYRHHKHRHHNYARYPRNYRGPYARFEYHSPGLVIVYER